jgi:cyclophilin family peptidyl-prolyl cis-trans isomerase/HEAT repeat protein
MRPFFLALLLGLSACLPAARRGLAPESRLLPGLSSPDAKVRAEAALGLFRRRFAEPAVGYSSAAVAGLTGLFSDADDEVRWKAVYAFSRFPEPRAQEALAKAASDKALWVRFFAVRSLGQLKEKAPADVLVRAARDFEPLVRVEGLKALGASGHGERLEPGMAEDPSVHVRAAFADAAAQGGADPSLLVPLEYDAAPLVRGQVLLAYGQLLKEAAAPRLLKEISHPHWWVRSRAYLALAKIPRGAEDAKQGVFEKDQRVASAALEGVALSSAPWVDDVLAKVLRDPASSLELRGTAADAASERKSPALLTAIDEALKNSGGREWYEVRVSLVKARNAIPGTTPLPEPKPAPEPARSWPKAPKQARVALKTEKGTIELELFGLKAPNHVASFLERVKAGGYDGTEWHRVVSGFVIQGGDPRGTGWGDCGFTLKSEVNDEVYTRGTLGMPDAGLDTGGCQLFITHVPTPHLDGRYTVFGRVAKGIESVDLIEPGDKILSAKVLSLVP